MPVKPPAVAGQVSMTIATSNVQKANNARIPFHSRRWVSGTSKAPNRLVEIFLQGSRHSVPLHILRFKRIVSAHNLVGAGVQRMVVVIADGVRARAIETVAIEPPRLSVGFGLLGLWIRFDVLSVYGLLLRRLLNNCPQRREGLFSRLAEPDVTERAEGNDLSRLVDNDSVGRGLINSGKMGCQWTVYRSPRLDDV